ncbi:GNAT family N-acetyltransferase [Leptospira yanagawae]|uniref:GNAT family N-acetyltransferase n=1 Tax=Leptospira yanagawae TaxID=293069 RepID=A0ABY2M4Z9_9LEPT|nr:GNAT family N-acetyltransferase [Leptospira yanagawae]TGL22545.1 GNAT family N-acetyltransferase [Leptospira yanagawae]
MELTIRKADISESQRIKSVLSTTWAETYKGIFSSDVIEKITSDWHSIRNITGQIESNDVIFQVALIGTNLIGLITLYQINSESFQLGRLYVLKEFQREGIGEKLFAKSLLILREKNVKRILVEIEKENRKAIDFYHKIGFFEVGQKSENLFGNNIYLIEMVYNIS